MATSVLIFILVISNVGKYTVREFKSASAPAQMGFLYAAEDCRYSLLPERFPNVTSDLSDAFIDALYNGLKSGRFRPDMDMFDVLDLLDKHSVHGKPILQAYNARRPYEPHADLDGGFWGGQDDERTAMVEAYLNCRIRYFHVTPRRTANDYVRQVDRWYGGDKIVPGARESAKLGDVLDRILAADDATARARPLRPAQKP